MCITTFWLPPGRRSCERKINFFLPELSEEKIKKSCFYPDFIIYAHRRGFIIAAWLWNLSSKKKKKLFWRDINLNKLAVSPQGLQCKINRACCVRGAASYRRIDRLYPRSTSAHRKTDGQVILFIYFFHSLFNDTHTWELSAFINFVTLIDPYFPLILFFCFFSRTRRTNCSLRISGWNWWVFILLLLLFFFNKHFICTCNN